MCGHQDARLVLLCGHGVGGGAISSSHSHFSHLNNEDVAK